MSTTLDHGPVLAGHLHTTDDHAAEREFRLAIGRRLRIVRVALQCSQDEIAAAAGVTRNFVSAIERGAQGPDAYRLSRVATAIGVPLVMLLEGTGIDAWVRQTSSLTGANASPRGVALLTSAADRPGPRWPAADPYPTLSERRPS